MLNFLIFLYLRGFEISCSAELSMKRFYNLGAGAPRAADNPKVWVFKFDIFAREYARGRRERRNRFRPADVAFFSSESDKNVALIFRKIRSFNIHFNIHTCHQLVFDLGRSSTRYPSGLHKKIHTW